MEEIKIINEKIERLKEMIERYEKPCLPADKPLTLIEAANYLGYSPSYIYKLTSKKEIPCYKPTGKKILFLKKELDEWIVNPASSSTTPRQGSEDKRFRG